MTISEYLTNEHRACDLFFATAEEAVAKKEWIKADEKFLDFSNEIRQHFQKEEEELFPIFEATTGITQGPTQVMKYEHEQIRTILTNMGEALEEKDKDAYLSLAESVMILLQQHNMKEEQMLYPMCDTQFPLKVKENVIDAMKKVSE